MIFYVLNVALILAGCFVFYKILLQKETFFPLNRFVLLGCLALSFSIPLIPIPQQWSFRRAELEVQTVTQQVVPTTQLTVSTVEPVSTHPLKTSVQKESIFKELSILKVLKWTYWLGVLIFAVNFLVQLIILLYRSYAKPVIMDGRFRIVELSGDQAPCSFGNNIFINPNKYDWETYSQIILHEKIHIQQGHSYDIFFAELALVFQWFNPFAWLYRKAMEDNLEFLTDNELLQHASVDRSSYQMSLVKVSAPHFPVSLTTNYNQSTLKKRLIMMNAKKSNVNSTWKYLFILPLLMVFVSFLNEPVVYGQTSEKAAHKNDKSLEMQNEGSWFATIKGDKVFVRFETDGTGNSSNTFLLSEFKDLPKNASGSFSLTRDAGVMVLTGKFEGLTGMGTYEFKTDEGFLNFLKQEGITTITNKDAMAFYMINLNRSYVKMLKDQGYDEISKSDLIALRALNVDEAYIKSIKGSGIENLNISELIPLKALNVDAAYIADIKSSGYKNLTADKLITFKAQGINGEYIKHANSAKTKKKETDEQMLAFDYKKDVKVEKINKKDLDDDMSAFGELIAKKALNITADYIKSIAETGFKVDHDEIIAMKSLGITPAYIKSFETAGLTNLKSDDIFAFKSLGITASDYEAYKKLGFKKITPDDLTSAKATGTSPAFILGLKKKGFNYNTIEKYIEMKVVVTDEQ